MYPVLSPSSKNQDEIWPIKGGTEFIIKKGPWLEKGKTRKHIITCISCCTLPLTCPLWCLANVCIGIAEKILNCCDIYLEPNTGGCFPPYKTESEVYFWSVFHPCHICNLDVDSYKPSHLIDYHPYGYLLESERAYALAPTRVVMQETEEEKERGRKMREKSFQDSMAAQERIRKLQEEEERTYPKKEQLDRIKGLLEEQNALLRDHLLTSGWGSLQEI